MRRIVSIFGSITLMLLFAFGCQEHQGTGSMTIKMKDAPVEFEAVNVEVLSVEIQYTGKKQSGWVALPTNTGIYNLLELQNGVTTVIADDGELPVGHVTQMRLFLGEENSVVIGGEEFPLSMSSQYNTGIKINIDSKISTNDNIEVLLDFDAQASVVVQGETTFRLKPVIKVERILYQ